MKLDKWQKDFLECKGDKILCTGRQVGKSEVCGMDAAIYAVTHPKTKPIVMIAPTERQAYGLFTKTLNYLANNYRKLLIVTGKDRPTKKRIKLRTGVEIYCLPVGKDGLGVRFLTIGRLYKDECSRIPELVHEAIDPALLTTGGDEILLSTPAGAIGTFHDVWVNKDNAFNSFKRFSVTSETVIKERPICATWSIKQREKALIKLDQAKARWSKRRYAQEYLGEFIEDLHRWFTDRLIESCCIGSRKEAINHESIFYLGVDIARMGEDDSAFEILEKRKGKIVHIESITTRKTRITDTEDKIKELHQKYHFRAIAIDAGSGSLGVGVLDHLLRDEEVRRQVVAVNNRARSLDSDDKTKTRILKEDLYDNLRAMMERGDIKLLQDGEVMASLRSVQYEYLIKPGEPTKLKIFGDFTHIAEGLIRAAIFANDKSLNPWVLFI